MNPDRARTIAYLRIIILAVTALLVLAILFLPVAVVVFLPLSLLAVASLFFFIIFPRALPLAAVRASGSGRSPPLFS